MIDTDKYEGHTPAPWQPWKNKRTIEVVRSQLAEKPVVCKVLNECDAQLIADAPLILQALIDERAEVKRLREIIQVQIVTPRSKDFFRRHYGKDDFEERWKEWADGIQNKVWGRKE